MNETESWFERNPKKTIFFVLIVVIVCSLGLLEYFLSRKFPHAILATSKRHIRLKEQPRLQNGYQYADRDALEQRYGMIIDGLEEKRYRFRTDESGFIEPSKIYDAPDLKVIFLGGSTTECAFVEEDSRFPYRAGRLLSEKNGIKVNSYNAGRSGNNSLHSINVFVNKILPLRPDVVFFMHNINDLNILLFTGTYWNDHPSRSPIVAEQDKSFGKRIFLIAKSFKDNLFPATYYSIKTLGLFDSHADEFNDQRRWKQANTNVDTTAFELNVLTFVQMCRAREILPVLMTQFNRFKQIPDAITKKNMDRFETLWGIDYASYKSLNDRFNEIIRGISAKHDVLMVDLDLLVPKENTHLYDIVHLNTNGSELVADLIANTLAENEVMDNLMKKRTHICDMDDRKREPRLESAIKAMNGDNSE